MSPKHLLPTVVAEKVDPKKETIVRPQQAPAFQGEGDHDYCCGNCAEVLAKGIHEGQISRLFVICPGCGRAAGF